MAHQRQWLCRAVIFKNIEKKFRPELSNKSVVCSGNKLLDMPIIRKCNKLLGMSINFRRNKRLDV